MQNEASYIIIAMTILNQLGLTKFSRKLIIGLSESYINKQQKITLNIT